MIGEILHVGVTVSDLSRSKVFYQDVLGMDFAGELHMSGRETEILFNAPGCEAQVAYFRGGRLESPPVELIGFTSGDIKPRRADLFSVSISEICFRTEDIWAEYRRLKAQGVEFLSEPQAFDFTADGFGKSTAVYFRDPDGIILELIEEG